MRTSTASEPPRERIAIFHPPGRMALTRNPFGKDVANLQLWRALARHGGFQQIDILSETGASTSDIVQDLFGNAAHETDIVSTSLTGFAWAAGSSALLRGLPRISDLAWMRRRRASDGRYSLVGLIHTVAPPEVRRIIADTMLAPVHDWDALICTSPAVQENVTSLFEQWGEYLAQRLGGKPPPRPRLPLLPLGVEAGAFTPDPDATPRRSIRGAYELGEDDVLVLWVGRLSYYEKAFPQVMFKAVEAATRTADAKRVVFVMAGWFPEASDQSHFRQAADMHAPSVAIHFVDGNDKSRLAELWAGADIFLSLVDNIQETFGITPLEAMASGLPVVVSDWDGYRATVRDGVDGFLIPTLGGPTAGGLGAAIVERHALELTSYQAYVGMVAQHTAVHVSRAADAISALVASRDLRRKMGESGRRRVLENFDWPVIAGQYRALVDELTAVRAAAAPASPLEPRTDPIRSDPFAAFGHFATHQLTLDMRLTTADGVDSAAVRSAGSVRLDGAFGGFRASPDVCAEAFSLIQSRGGAPVREILEAFPMGDRRQLELGLAWMAKCGFVDWL